MRIYNDQMEMVREVERDLWEMGVTVHPQTMQDKDVRNNPDYITKELSPASFMVTHPEKNLVEMVNYLFPGAKGKNLLEYIEQEHKDRVSETSMNPGNAHVIRPDVWGEFLHEGKFSYTYSERITPQLRKIIHELCRNPESRQCIIEIHNNLIGDVDKIGGRARIPCSMHYQFLIRDGKLNGIYIMRSCDFLTHFAVDIALATMLTEHISWAVGRPLGSLTYFTGSLHAYHKDMKARGIF